MYQVNNPKYIIKTGNLIIQVLYQYRHLYGISYASTLILSLKRLQEPHTRESPVDREIRRAP